MGIAPYKTFTFDGESSADYGVYITGTGVFNAPERSVEMIDIPSRNGAYALDRGRFENIEVTYNVGIVDDNEADFADRVSDFRNWLCSKVGYCRLEDEYNPDEYRMALFSSGVEIDHDLLIAGEAEITFNCKPQRWLKSGETAVTVADGGTIDNPTLFDSSPLLELYGYGSVDIDGQTVTLNNDVLGEIKIRDGGTSQGLPNTRTIPQDNIDKLNNGDSITCDYVKIRLTGTVKSSCTINSFTVNSFSGIEFEANTKGTSRTITFTNLVFEKGTSKTISGTLDLTIDYTEAGTSKSTHIATSPTVAYDGNRTITISYNSSMGLAYSVSSISVPISAIYGDSSMSILGNPSYIDCDIGEAYMVSGGDITPLNNLVILPSDLPTLKPGTNTINYDNTFTKVDIVPRWWKV